MPRPLRPQHLSQHVCGWRRLRQLRPLRIHSFVSATGTRSRSRLCTRGHRHRAQQMRLLLMLAAGTLAQRRHPHLIRFPQGATRLLRHL